MTSDITLNFWEKIVQLSAKISTTKVLCNFFLQIVMLYSIVPKSSNICYFLLLTLFQYMYRFLFTDSGYNTFVCIFYEFIKSAVEHNIGHVFLTL